MKNFKVWCKTKDERDAVLEKMASDGITWYGTNGQKPNKKSKSIPDVFVGFIISDNVVSWTKSAFEFICNIQTEITVEEYLNKGEQI